MDALADRNLLFGLLALQNGIIDQAALFVAFSTWTRDKAHSLTEILLNQGAINDDDLAMLSDMAAWHFKRHGDDAEKSLAAVAVGPSTREKLAALSDTDLTASIAFVGSHTPSQDATATMSVGSATSNGQRFRVLRPHAQGGLGAVFVALDGELNREVALKQILDHHADDQVSRTRFMIEAQITGGLEHPGIVPVYGLGHYDDGRPYYAMRFIRGDSLKDAIAVFHGDETLKKDPGKKSLALRKLLRRFVNVCNAIDYAHGRGILHRDLKPGNVIVGRHGETLVVDWGLAKAMGSSEVGSPTDERTLMPSSSSGSAETLPGSAIGTPSYMSPEQARGDLERLGPRSDVYSLGATLYCLLTSRAPFEGRKLFTILHDVQKGAFPKPRQYDPSIDKALEAVCLKAMATNPDDRHATARALADDVERWAADEPVSAWREPASVLARRWMRRNRTAVTATAVALLATLFGAAAVLAVQAQANGVLKKSNTLLAIANAKEMNANAALNESNTALAAAKDREVARFALAADAIKLFQGQVGDDLVLKEDRFKPLRDKLLVGAADFYAKLEKLLQGQTDRASRKAMGNAYFELGELTSKIGDQPAALAVHRKALVVRRALAAEPGADAGTKLDVALSLISAGVWQMQTGDMAGARASFSEARDLAEAAETERAAADQAREVVGSAYFRFATVLYSTGDMAGALTAYGKALAIQQKLVDDNPSVTELQRALATTHHNIGFLLFRTGDMAGALTAYGKALAIQQKLVDDNPSVTELQQVLAYSHNHAGLVLSETGDPAGALTAYGKALAIQQKLVDANPSVTVFQEELGQSHGNIGLLLAQMGEPAEALTAYGKALAIRQKLVNANPIVPDYRDNLAMAQNNRADVLRRLGRNAEAREGYERAIAIDEQVVREHPQVPHYRRHLAWSLRGRAQVRPGLVTPAGAAADTRRALELWDGLPPRSGEDWFEASCCHATLAALAGREGSGVSSGEAASEAHKAMALLTKAVGMGYRDANQFRIEAALDFLRNRPDFELLMDDLTFPADPFAR